MFIFIKRTQNPEGTLVDERERERERERRSECVIIDACTDALVVRDTDFLCTNFDLLSHNFNNISQRCA